VDAKRLATLAERLVAQPPRGPLEEVQQQNQELLGTLRLLGLGDSRRGEEARTQRTEESTSVHYSMT
jgi:hypothetical protein